jgi:response regulator RpfG family c-di-GMP phosphodiesterase
LSRKTRKQDEALHQSSGTQFDPAVVKSFVRFAQSEMSAVLEAVGVSDADTF